MGWRYSTPLVPSNKGAVLAAVARTGHALQYAWDELRKDKEVARTPGRLGGARAPLRQAGGAGHGGRERARAGLRLGWAPEGPGGAAGCHRRKRLQEGLLRQIPLDHAHPTLLKAVPSLQGLAAIADDAERAAVAADPATIWAVEVEHQAIATLAGNLDYKPADRCRWLRRCEPTEESLERLTAADARVAQHSPYSFGKHVAPRARPPSTPRPSGGGGVIIKTRCSRQYMIRRLARALSSRLAFWLSIQYNTAKPPTRTTLRAMRGGGPSAS